MIRRILCTPLLCLALLAGSGCMSFDHLLDPEQELDIYGGTKSSARYIADGNSPFFGTIIRIADFPLTLVMDTLLLPITWPIVGSGNDTTEPPP